MPHVWGAASASVSSLHTDGSSRLLAPAAAAAGGAGGGQARSFSKFKGGSLREKGGGGAGGKGGKGGQGAAVGGAGEKGVGVGGMEEELLTLDPAELELPPGIKTDSECWCGGVGVVDALEWVDHVTDVRCRALMSLVYVHSHDAGGDEDALGRVQARAAEPQARAEAAGPGEGNVWVCVCYVHAMY